LNSCSNQFLGLVIADVCTLADYVSTVCCDLKEMVLSRKVISEFHRCSKLYSSEYKNADGKVLTPFDVFIRQVVASELIDENFKNNVVAGVDFSKFGNLDYLELQRYPVRKLPENDETEIDQDSKNPKKITRSKKRTSQQNETSTAKKQNTNVSTERLHRRSKKPTVATDFPPELFIRFCYYNSIILTVQKKYETAIFYLELVLSNKKVATGFIQLEALKKYWLLKTLCAKSAFSIPNVDETMVLRNISTMRNVILSSRRRSAFQVPRPEVFEEQDDGSLDAGNQNSGIINLENYSENKNSQNQSSNPSNSEARQPRNMSDIIQEEAYKTVMNAYSEVLSNISTRIGFGIKNHNQKQSSFSEFCKICDKFKTAFQTDSNYGLVIRLKYELLQRCIMKLAEVFTCLPIKVFQHCLDCDEILVNSSLKELFEKGVLKWEVINESDDVGSVIRFSVIKETPKIEINELIQSITRMKQVSEELTSVNHALTQTCGVLNGSDAVEDKMDNY